MFIPADELVFEIRDPQTGKRLAAIWYDGRTEGLPQGIVTNRMRRLMEVAVMNALGIPEQMKWSEDLCPRWPRPKEGETIAPKV